MEYWTINPIMLQIGPITARWYGFMYAITFIICYLYIHYSKHGKTLKMKPKEKDSMVIFGMTGIILGARIGYILFYNFISYLQNPLKIFAVWEGGMASHGAVIGLAFSILFYSYISKKDFLKITDIITSIAPVGIILVRIGNFINGELYGRIAENFCIHFPTDPGNCRYPSQLFQAFLEGFVLLIIMQIIARKSKKTGHTSAYFLILYGIFRIIGECFREPDPQIGFLLGGVTLGQMLSFVMIVGGFLLLLFLRKREK